MELLRGGDIADDFARESDPMTPALRQVCSMKFSNFLRSHVLYNSSFPQNEKKIAITLFIKSHLL